jgi:hypothetical protein
VFLCALCGLVLFFTLYSVSIKAYENIANDGDDLDDVENCTSADEDALAAAIEQLRRKVEVCIVLYVQGVPYVRGRFTTYISLKWLEISKSTLDMTYPYRARLISQPQFLKFH